MFHQLVIRCLELFLVLFKFKMKKIHLESWTTFDKLCLISSIAKLKQSIGDQNWVAISRHTKQLSDTIGSIIHVDKRSDEWYSVRQCAAQYENLLKIYGIRKKKRIDRSDLDNLESLENNLRIELTDEMKRSLNEVKDEYLRNKKILYDLENDRLDDEQLEQLVHECSDEDRGVNIKSKLKSMLDEKSAENESSKHHTFSSPSVLDLPPPPPPPPPPAPTSEVKTSSTTSPLLTSLLQSPSPLVRPNMPSTSSPTISLLLNSSPSVPITDSALSKLLENTPSMQTPAPTPISSSLPMPSSSSQQASEPKNVVEEKTFVFEKIHKEKIDGETIIVEDMTDIEHDVIESEIIIEDESPPPKKNRIDLDVVEVLEIDDEDDDDVEIVESEDTVLETVEEIIERVEEAIIETVGESNLEDLEQELCQSDEPITIDGDIGHLEIGQNETVEVIVLPPDMNPDAQTIINDDTVIISASPMKIGDETVIIEDTPIEIAEDTVIIEDSEKIDDGTIVISNSPVKINKDTIVIDDSPMKVSNDTVVISDSSLKISGETVVIEQDHENPGETIIIDSSSGTEDENSLKSSQRSLMVEESTDIALKETEGALFMDESTVLKESAETVIMDESHHNTLKVTDGTLLMESSDKSLKVTEASLIMDVSADTINVDATTVFVGDSADDSLKVTKETFITEEASENTLKVTEDIHVLEESLETNIDTCSMKDSEEKHDKNDTIVLEGTEVEISEAIILEDSVPKSVDEDHSVSQCTNDPHANLESEVELSSINDSINPRVDAEQNIKDPSVDSMSVTDSELVAQSESSVNILIDPSVPRDTLAENTLNENDLNVTNNDYNESIVSRECAKNASNGNQDINDNSDNTLVEPPTDITGLSKVDDELVKDQNIPQCDEFISTVSFDDENNPKKENYVKDSYNKNDNKDSSVKSVSTNRQNQRKMKNAESPASDNSKKKVEPAYPTLQDIIALAGSKEAAMSYLDAVKDYEKLKDKRIKQLKERSSGHSSLDRKDENKEVTKEKNEESQVKHKEDSKDNLDVSTYEKCDKKIDMNKKEKGAEKLKNDDEAKVNDGQNKKDRNDKFRKRKEFEKDQEPVAKKMRKGSIEHSSADEELAIAYSDSSNQSSSDGNERSKSKGLILKDKPKEVIKEKETKDLELDTTDARPRTPHSIGSDEDLRNQPYPPRPLIPSPSKRKKEIKYGTVIEKCFVSVSPVNLAEVRSRLGTKIGKETEEILNKRKRMVKSPEKKQNTDKDKPRASRKRSFATSSFDSTPESPSCSTASSEDDRDQKAWKKSIMLIYARIASHKYASIFSKPITDVTDYDDTIYVPMDLSTLKRNIETGVIRSTMEFQRDVIVMIENAKVFNEENSPYYEMAVAMGEDILKEMEVMISALGDGVQLFNTSNEERTRARSSKASEQAPSDGSKSSKRLRTNSS